ncbi:MAG: hypothetical protein M1819_000327 [Sarea resinae]|nr:MAG: hypothetical protein M1819_000327 [Sarea resinae]
MPPKRRRPAAAGASSSSAAEPKAKRASKLARECGISADEEAEIKEAWALFANRASGVEEDDEEEEEDNDDEGAYRGDGEEVMRVGDVRRALVALGIPPTSPQDLRSLQSTLDPLSTGHVPYAPFLQLCGLKLAARHASHDSEAQRREIDDAFRLFTHGSTARGGGSGGGGGPAAETGPESRQKITLGTLKRVARELREEVDEAVLRDMILEANGGEGVGRGVGRDEFEGVMRRAGVFG